MKLFERLRSLLPLKNGLKNSPPPEPSPPRLYTIFAGINGAGKTSLYSVLRDSADLGERINIDEIATSMGSWRDTLIQIKAGREAINHINDCIKRGVSFHQETTLPGPTIEKHIRLAKKAGFYIRLYYVGVDDLSTCIERVHRRVANGGHGIDDETIRKRFENITGELKQLIPLCDEAIFYDNTVRFRQVAMLKDGEVVDADRDLPRWFGQLGLILPSDPPVENI